MDFISRSVFILVGPLLSGILSCQSPRAQRDAAVAMSRVEGSTECSAHVPQFDTGNGTTLMYHWTNNPLAAKNPMDYIKSTVEASVAANRQGFGTGFAGNGFYLASDPFSTRVFGNILLTVPIKPHLKVANWTEEGGSDRNFSLSDVYNTYNCREIVYSYTSLYDPFRALALTSIRIIDETQKIAVLIVPATQPDVAEIREVGQDVSLGDFFKEMNQELFAHYDAAASPEELLGGAHFASWAAVRMAANGFAEDHAIYLQLRNSPSFQSLLRNRPSLGKFAIHEAIWNIWQSSDRDSLALADLKAYFGTLGWDLKETINHAALWEKVNGLFQGSDLYRGLISFHKYQWKFRDKEVAQSISVWK
ncbi:MAG: hypothetical protein WCI18_13895 [Pseudomonadota bacterium]